MTDDYSRRYAEEADNEQPYTVSCPPNRKHAGTIEFAPTDARHPVCPVCGQEVVR